MCVGGGGGIPGSSCVCDNFGNRRFLYNYSTIVLDGIRDSKGIRLDSFTCALSRWALPKVRTHPTREKVHHSTRGACRQARRVGVESRTCRRELKKNWEVGSTGGMPLESLGVWGGARSDGQRQSGGASDRRGTTTRDRTPTTDDHY